MDARRIAPARAIPCQAEQRRRRAFSRQPRGAGRFGRIPLSRPACCARTAARDASRAASRIDLAAGAKIALTGPSDAYLEKARLLSKEETERLLSRMRTKLMRRLEVKKLSTLEVAAIQLEIEDEDLNEWRERWAEMKKAELKKKTKAK